MNDTQLREALRLIDEPRSVPAAFTENVFAAMLSELDAERVPATAPATPRRRALSWSWSFLWRPAIAFAVAIALVLGVVSYLTVSDARSALAALQDARQRFQSMPSYHARTAVAANDDASNPDFETTWATEDWYQDATRWRTTTTAGNLVGNYRVMTPDLYVEYDAASHVLTARPTGEGNLAEFGDPSFFFDPSLQWWSTGAPDDMGKPSDQFFEENCTATSTTIIGRAATKLDCEAEPRDLELWLDDATGMILRAEFFDITREITSLELSPRFPDGVFDTAPPEGAKKRWDGQGPPPPDFAVNVGSEVTARYPIVEGRVAGFSIAAITTSDLWTTVVRCSNRCDNEIVRTDVRTGRVVATVAPPPGMRVDDLIAVDDEIWAALVENTMETPTPAAFVQRFDVKTNQFVGEPIRTGTSGGYLAVAGGALWSTGGPHRDVKIGRAESSYNALARIDLRTGEVEAFDLGTSAGSLVAVAESLWVVTSAIDTRDPEETLYELVEFDTVTRRVIRRVVIPGWPNEPVTDGATVFTLYGDSSQQWHLAAVDTATGGLSSTPIGAPRAQLGNMTVGGGHLWMASYDDGGALKIDLTTRQPVLTIATGLGPSGIGFGSGSVWVSHAGDGSLARLDVE